VRSRSLTLSCSCQIDLVWRRSMLQPGRGAFPRPYDRLQRGHCDLMDGHLRRVSARLRDLHVLTGGIQLAVRAEWIWVFGARRCSVRTDDLVPRWQSSIGYRTACVGKWHLGWNWPHPPDKRVFSHTGYRREKELSGADDEHRARRAGGGLFKPIPWPYRCRVCRIRYRRA